MAFFFSLNFLLVVDYSHWSGIILTHFKQIISLRFKSQILLGSITDLSIYSFLPLSLSNVWYVNYLGNLVLFLMINACYYILWSERFMGSYTSLQMKNEQFSNSIDLDSGTKHWCFLYGIINWVLISSSLIFLCDLLAHPSAQLAGIVEYTNCISREL